MDLELLQDGIPDPDLGACCGYLYQHVKCSTHVQMVRSSGSWTSPCCCSYLEEVCRNGLLSDQNLFLISSSSSLLALLAVSRIHDTSGTFREIKPSNSATWKDAEL